jgi:hypothetical protein
VDNYFAVYIVPLQVSDFEPHVGAFLNKESSQGLYKGMLIEIFV